LRTIIFIDGYNLYYGALQRSPYKWLDLYQLFREHILLPDTELLEVRYYTAPVLGSLCDDPESPKRQRQYLQALRKMPPAKTQVIEGKLTKNSAHLRLSEPIPQAPELNTVRVITLTEKKTDVNIATDMVSGAFLGNYDQAVLCSNDSDMEGALRSIRTHCPNIRLGLVAPVLGATTRHISRDLKQQVHWVKTLNAEALKAAQLPEKVPGTSIAKPTGW